MQKVKEAPPLTDIFTKPSGEIEFRTQAEALEYMKSMNQSGVFDETAGDDFEEYTKVFNYLNETPNLNRSSFT